MSIDALHRFDPSDSRGTIRFYQDCFGWDRTKMLLVPATWLAKIQNCRIQMTRLELAFEIEPHVLERIKLGVFHSVGAMHGLSFSETPLDSFFDANRGFCQRSQHTIRVDSRGELKSELVDTS